MKSAVLSVRIHAPIETVFNVIVDYESYPSFLEEMSKVKVLERWDTGGLVSFTIKVIKEINYILEFTEDRPHSIRWKLKEGNIFKVNEGGWDLSRVSKTETEANYMLKIALALLMPGWVEEQLTSKALPLTLNRFKERAEAKARAMK